MRNNQMHQLHKYKIPAVISLFLLFGCMDSLSLRRVNGNNFLSDRFPTAEIAVSSKLTYLGECKLRKYMDFTTNGGGAFVKEEHFIFGEQSSTRIVRGVIISLTTAERGMFLPTMFKSIEYKLEYDDLKAFGKSFKYCIFANPSLRPVSAEVHLIETGYKLPTCLLHLKMGRIYTRRNKNDTLLEITYFVDVSKLSIPCRNWLEFQNLSAKQIQEKANFKEAIKNWIEVRSLE